MIFDICDSGTSVHILEFLLYLKMKVPTVNPTAEVRFFHEMQMLFNRIIIKFQKELSF